MQKVGYILSLPFLYGMSWLPFWMLYILSDFASFVIYRIWGYRKQVVKTNLRNSFPNKSEKEIDEIMARFYQNFTDQLVETVKGMTLSKQEFFKRVQFKNPELLDRSLSSNNSLLVAMSHHCNWEWIGMLTGDLVEADVAAIYRPLRNPYFDQLVKKTRTRFKTGVTPMKQTMRWMVKRRKTPHLLMVIGDQTPSPIQAHWIEFLHQDTPFFMGLEKMSRKFNSNIVFYYARKIGRGKYEVEIMPIDKDLEGEGAITKAFAKLLEAEITESPEMWLWSHRRWKHKKPPEVEKV